MMLLAETRWPTTLDAFVTIAFILGVLLIAGLGYVYMVLDYRAYLRSLRRMLVRVTHYLPELPAWARMETPRAIKALGLQLPCTEADLLQAYREQVKELHPDRGGDKRRFLQLQQNFEEAMRVLAELESAKAPSQT